MIALALLACAPKPPPAEPVAAHPEVALSAFTSSDDRAHLLWQRIDPVADTTRVVARLPSCACMSAEVAWSPDLRRAALVPLSQLNPPNFQVVFEVDAVTGALRELPPAPFLSGVRLDDEGALAFTIHFEDLPGPPSPERPCRAEALRERDGGWTRVEGLDTTCRESGWRALASAAGVGPSAFELANAPLPWREPPSEALPALHALRADAAAAPDGAGEGVWRVLADAPAVAGFVWDGETVVGLARVQGATASPLEGLPDAPPGGFRVQVRPGWVLVRNQGTRAWLYDAQGNLVWESVRFAEVTFWPVASRPPPIR